MRTEYKFLDKKSKRLFEKTRNLNEAVKQSESNFIYSNENKIPRNLFFGLSCLQIQEIYSRGDNKFIESLFKRILDNSNKDKYAQNKRQVDECILKLKEGKYRFSSEIFPNMYLLPQKTEYLESVTISVISVGNSFFKIVYNCFPTDYMRYKYWLYATSDAPNQIILKSNCIKRTTTIKSIGGSERKRSLLKELERCFYYDSLDFVKSIGSGFLMKIFNDFPATLVCYHFKQNHIYSIGGHKFYDKKENTDFYNIVIDCDANHGNRYIDSKENNVFASIPENANGFCNMYMKHIRNPSSLSSPSTEELSWMAIIRYLLKKQLSFITDINNNYYHYDINDKKINFSKTKKTINRIESFLRIVNSEYNIEENYSFRYAGEMNLSYTCDLGEYEIEFIKEHKDSISYLFERIEKEKSLVKEIYSDRYAENNSRTNTFLQIFAVILSIVMIAQPFVQCGINKKDEEKKMELFDALLEESKKQNAILETLSEKIEYTESVLDEMEAEIQESEEKILEENKE